jgi:DNA primase
MKYKNPTASKNVVAFEFHINWKHPLVLVEGVYDAIAVKRNAIPLLGKTIPNKLLQQIYAHNVKQIYLALDTDALSATADIASLLVQNGLEVRLVPLDGKDPSEIGFSRMVDLIKQAKPLSFADLIKLRVTA